MYNLITDLDNTLIYSHRKEIGKKILVEKIETKEQSYMTYRTYNLFKEIIKKINVVPLTTRTIKQYKRISILSESPYIKYALVSNGSILLINNVIDEEWCIESYSIFNKSQHEINKAITLIQNQKNITTQPTMLDNMILYTKTTHPTQLTDCLKKTLDKTKISVYKTGNKVYIIPKGFEKGNSVIRLKKRFGFANIICAGDSDFDISMLGEADIAIYPHELNITPQLLSGINAYPIQRGIFSDGLLENILRIIKEKEEF